MIYNSYLVGTFTFGRQAVKMLDKTPRFVYDDRQQYPTRLLTMRTKSGLFFIVLFALRLKQDIVQSLIQYYKILLLYGIIILVEKVLRTVATFTWKAVVLMKHLPESNRKEL